MPCARCIREFSTSLADTKKMWSGAWSRSTTFSSSTRKFTQRSVCCFLTLSDIKRLELRKLLLPPASVVVEVVFMLLDFTYILHVLWLIGRGVPAVVKDEDVGLWQTFIYFVKKMFFLQERWRMTFSFNETTSTIVFYLKNKIIGLKKQKLWISTGQWTVKIWLGFHPDDNLWELFGC